MKRGFKNDKDIGRWITSCKTCQRVQCHILTAGFRSVAQFPKMDVIGMDYGVGFLLAGSIGGQRWYGCRGIRGGEVSHLLLLGWVGGAAVV